MTKAPPRSRTDKPSSGALTPPFIQLDYLYTPSAEVAADMNYFLNVLGAEVGFAVEGMGARVAMLRLTEGPPHVLLTDHLAGDQTIFIYRVGDFDSALRDLRKRGWKKAHNLEIPMGPCCSFTTPGGQRLAVYELSRPQVLNHLLGRRDF